jgi:hypothetical protein
MFTESASTGGVKDKLAERIAKKESNLSSVDELALKIDEFLSPTVHTHKRPTVHQHYAEFFNLIDRFNRYVSMVRYRPRCSSEAVRVLSSLIEICIVESWVLIQDSNWKGEKETGIREFGIALANSLV